MNELIFEQQGQLKAQRKKKLLIIGGAVLGVLLLLGGVFAFLKIRNRGGIISPIGEDENHEPKSAFNFNETKGDVASPINGAWYSKEVAAEWEKKRPMAIMIANNLEARPQSGLSFADIVYEAVAEGGITRFLAVYQTQEVDKLGPVRSARVYYINWAREYDAWYAHCGGAYAEGSKANIYDYINGEGYYAGKSASIPDLDEMWLGSMAYWRTNDREAPHNLYTSTKKLREAGLKKYPTWTSYKETESWKFKDDGKGSGGASVSFGFWQDDNFKVTWDYDSSKNIWARSQGGIAHVDRETNQQLSAKVVIVQFIKEVDLKDEKAHLWYDTMEGGDALIYQDGKEVKAIWKKPFAAARTRFYVAGTDTEIKFNRGQIWVEVVPDGKEVTFKAS